MEVTLDKYGRIVIPKPVRERLGLEAGTSLVLGVEPMEGGEPFAGSDYSLGGTDEN